MMENLGNMPLCDVELLLVSSLDMTAIASISDPVAAMVGMHAIGRTF